MHRKSVHRIATLAIALAASGLGQNANEAVVISQDFVVEGRVVKGVPYSAQAVTSVKQTLATGSEIVTQMTALVARDAEGRTRREQTIRAIGPWAVLSPLPSREPARGGVEERRDGPTVILIQDPVKQLNYTLDPRTHIARVTRQAPPREMERPRNGEERPGGSGRQAERTNALGSQVIEGVSAQGTRTVTILEAGSIGNSARIEIVVETWYSPDLKVVVLGRRRDPRVGDITYRLTNIKRSDPSALLFEVPIDYRIDGDLSGRKLNEREPRK